MSAGPLVVDTHAAVWYLQRDQRLSRRAEADIDDALAGGYAIHVPSIAWSNWSSSWTRDEFLPRSWSV